MDVAVPGVTEARNQESRFLPEPFDELEQLRHPAPRDDDVVVDLAGRQSPQREGELAPRFPNGGTLGIICRPANRKRAGRPAGIEHARTLLFDPGRTAIDLDDEHGARSFW